MFSPFTYKLIYGSYLFVLLVTSLIYKFSNNPSHFKNSIKAHILCWGLFMITITYQVGFNGLAFYITAPILFSVLIVVVQKAHYCSYCGRLTRFANFFTLLNFCPKCDGNN